MVSARRLIFLRLTAMAALCVSTLLTYDTLHPDRPFCPLAEACEKVRESALGSIAGVPTSLLGMAAFGGLFLLTLLPIEWARRLLKPAGLVSALSGAGLFAYQAVVIKAFCPLCLIADTAGLVAGLLTLTWGELPRRRSGRRLGGESAASRVAWTLAAVLAVVLPFAWPREVQPAWVEIAPEFDLFPDVPVDVASAPPGPAGAPGSAAGPGVRPQPPPMPPPLPPQPPPRATGALPPPPAAPGATVGPAPLTPVPPPAGSSVPPPAPLPAAPAPAAPPPRPAPAPAQVQIVEYLNAYCAHCRATHKRLGKVLTELGVTPRVRRVYTWAGNDVPLWAHACAFAQTVGREEAMFEALLETSRGDARDIYSAAQRAGVDRAALEQALASPALAPRLVRDRELFQSARLQGLPTFDIGRRRLMGEQSENELRAAVEAAQAALGAR